MSEIMDRETTEFQTETGGIYAIPVENMDRFKAKVATLSRRAKKLGQTEISFKIVGTTTRKLRDGYKHEMIMVQIDEPVIGINGWTFVATLDHSLGDTLIRAMPGALPLPESFRSAEGLCQHCNTIRRRNATHVLHCAATDEFKQVGSNCVADFFGHDPNMLAARAEMVRDLAAEANECEDFTGGAMRRLETALYVTHCAAIVRTIGWVSRAEHKANGMVMATADLALTNMFERKAKHRTALIEEDYATAKAALAWACALADKTNLSEYEYNLTTLAGKEMIDHKHLGIVASVIPGYIRHRERVAARKAALASPMQSTHLGAVGERLRGLKATVIGNMAKTGLYGIVYIYRFLTIEGHVLVWFSSTDAKLELAQSVLLTGTVKKHQVHEEVKNTILSRCKVTLVPVE